VLVAIVVLLIGILSVLRLFPGGFLSIQRTAEATAAANLAQQNLDVEKNLLSVPQEIVAVDPTSDIYALNTNQRPDDLSDYNPAVSGAISTVAYPNVPATLAPYYFSNINRIRTIHGETTRIPIANPNAVGGLGSAYMLQYGPVFNVFTTNSTTGAPVDSLRIVGAPLTRIEADSTAGPPPLTSPDQYAIDYPNQKIAFFPRLTGTYNVAYRLFSMTFSFFQSPAGSATPVVQTTAVTVQVNDVAANSDPSVPVQPVWQSIFTGATNDTAPTNPDGSTCPLQPETEAISRQFRLTTQFAATQDGAANPNFPTGTGGTPNPGFDQDPYEYCWYTDNEPGTDANFGVLVFNPLGHTYLESTSTGTQPLVARIDYSTLDNHILREDRAIGQTPAYTPASGSPFTVKLSVPFLQTNGDVITNPPGVPYTLPSPYNGMFRIAGTTTFDLVVINPTTGQYLGVWQNGVGELPNGPGAFKAGGILNNATSTNPAGTGNLDPKTGNLTLDYNYVTTNNLTNATVRIFYCAQGDWGMGVQKAHAVYNRALAANGAVTLAYNQFYYLANTGDPAGSTPTRIYFPVSESGKSVTLTNFTIVVYQSVNGTLTPTPMTFQSEQYRINNNRSLDETLPGAGEVTWLDITEHHPAQANGAAAVQGQIPYGQALVFDDALTGQGVAGVRGASIKTRVIWRDGTTQTGWRKIDYDTYLVPAATQ
jgi:hypothetical protein